MGREEPPQPIMACLKHLKTLSLEENVLVWAMVTMKILMRT